MANLDELSVTLGEIRSDVKHVLRWQDEHEEADQRRFAALAQRLDSADIVRAQVRMDLIEAEVLAAKPVIEGVRKARWALMGFILAVSLVGGSLGSVAMTTLKWF
jgi:hypothetical protein